MQATSAIGSAGSSGGHSRMSNTLFPRHPCQLRALTLVAVHATAAQVTGDVTTADAECSVVGTGLYSVPGAAASCPYSCRGQL